MKTICKTERGTTSFIISDLEPVHHDAVRSLYYSLMEEGFAKSYPSDTPHLDHIYLNFEQYAEEMILQMVGVHSVPWDRSLLAFLQIIENEEVNWWLAGSAALAVRGIDVIPHDLDLVVDGASAIKLGELLLDYLVEPVLPSHGWIADWFGRAFLYARLEWVGNVSDSVDSTDVTDFGPIAGSHLEVIDWHDKKIHVPPLELQLKVTERRGLTERAEKIRHFMNGKK
ncbi:MAG: hypothetical protein QG641_941 [Candidatus Poribacteria bacterium]|nr:hypothetical protein [Candidatus Poribacteria bacterium]